MSKKVIEEVLDHPHCFLAFLTLFQIGQPTIIVNNAGVVQGKLLVDLSPEDIRQYVVYCE